MRVAGTDPGNAGQPAVAASIDAIAVPAVAIAGASEPVAPPLVRRRDRRRRVDAASPFWPAAGASSGTGTVSTVAALWSWVAVVPAPPSARPPRVRVRAALPPLPAPSLRLPDDPPAPEPRGPPAVAAARRRLPPVSPLSLI